MPLTIGFAIYIFLIAVLLSGVSYLIWKTMSPLLTRNKLARKVIVALLGLMTVGIPYNIWLVRFLPVSEKGILSELTHVWAGAIFYFVFYFMVCGILIVGFRLLNRNKVENAELKLERRDFLRRSFGGIVGTLTVGSSAVGYARVKEGPKLEKVDVSLTRLPASMDGLKIVQVSDLHVGPLIDKTYVEEVVAIVNQCNPDLVALTGDFVDGSVAALAEDVEALRNIKSKYGVFFITGNHEFYSGVGPWIEKFRSMGIRVLENEHVLIENGTDDFYLLGIHDPTAKRFGMVSDVELAIAGCDPSKMKILLAHQPKSVFNADKHDIDLQLSGHTHAGQMWPLGYLAAKIQPYVQGLHRHSTKLQIYVNRGTGYWGPPMRIPYSSEITQLTLHKA